MNNSAGMPSGLFSRNDFFFNTYYEGKKYYHVTCDVISPLASDKSKNKKDIILVDLNNAVNLQ